MRFTVPLAASNVALLVCAALVVAGAVPQGEAALATADGGVATPSARPAPAASAPGVVGTAPAAVPGATPVAAPPVVVESPAPAPQVVPAPQRAVVSTGWQPYATVGPVTLHYPGDVVEVVGLHQAGHDGAQPQEALPDGPARMGRLGTRARGTHDQGAADIVVDPTREVRSPVTGTVLRAGSYTLYCDHVDDFLVVEPDARPGWEVKLLHFEGLRVRQGDRVEAGVTVVGARARVLPFASQVDKHTLAPHWPHLHVEVVDPSVPDRPSGGGCR